MNVEPDWVKMSIDIANYKAFYKRIKNRFRKYDQADLARKLWWQMNSVPSPFSDKSFAWKHHDYSHLPWHPWSDLLLLKWILMDDWFLRPHRKKLDESVLFELRSEMWRYTAETGHLNKGFSSTLFIRAVAHQQNTYQEQIDLARVLRQFKYFSYLEHNHSFRTQFKSETDLDIEEVLLLNSFLSVECMRDNYFRPLKYDIFSKTGLSEEKVTRYLRLMSGTQILLRDYLTDKKNNIKKPGSHPNEYFEKSPFVLKPLVQFRQNELYPIHKSVVTRCAENYLYQYFRQSNPEKFMDKFGKPIYEKYMRELIHSTGVEFYSEKEIENIYRQREACNGKKVIDFLVRDDSLNLFIDAKGVSPVLDGMVSSDPLTVQRRTKSAIEAAIGQGNDTVETLANTKKCVSGVDDNVLLVVTYEELMLGNGFVLNEILRGTDYKMVSEHFDLRSILFLDIGEFQLLCENVAKGRTTFKEVFDLVRKDESCIHQSKLSFSSYFDVLGIEWDKESAVGDMMTEIERVWNKTNQVVGS